MHKLGFTLIELLVTIAIIGVLAAVILSRLNEAQESGLETKVIAELEMLQKRAAIEESQQFHYDMICGSNGETQSEQVTRIINSIEQFASSTVVCNSSPSAYAVSAPIQGTNHWCVDSSGASGEIGAALGSGVLACP